MKKVFLKNFSKFLLLGISVFVLFIAAQSTALNLNQKGPQAVLADNDCPLDPEFGYIGCANPGTQEGIYFPPEEQAPVEQPIEYTPPAPQPQPEPVSYNPAPQPQAQPTPSCPDDHIYCDTNYNQLIHKRGGTWNGSECVYAFVPVGVCNQPTQPQPQPEPRRDEPTPTQRVCVPNEWNSSTCSRCVGDGSGWQPTGTDFGTYDGIGGAWCGCAQKHSNYTPSTYPQCFNTQTPVQTPITPTTRAADLPACPTPGQAGTQQVCNGQYGYDDCKASAERYADGTPKSYYCEYTQNRHCQGTILCAQPAAPVASVAPAAPVQNNRQTNTQINTQQQVNNQSQSVTLTIPQGAPQVVTRTEIVREAPLAMQVATVNCPANTIKRVQDNQIVCIQNAQAGTTPAVRVAGVYDTKELPKTGLPLLAYAAAAFIPLGAKLKGFKKVTSSLISHPNYLWQERQFKV